MPLPRPLPLIQELREEEARPSYSVMDWVLGVKPEQQQQLDISPNFPLQDFVDLKIGEVPVTPATTSMTTPSTTTTTTATRAPFRRVRRPPSPRPLDYYYHFIERNRVDESNRGGDSYSSAQCCHEVRRQG